MQGYVDLLLAMAAVDAVWSFIGIGNFATTVEQINWVSSPVEDKSDTLLQTTHSKCIYKATTNFSTSA